MEKRYLGIKHMKQFRGYMNLLIFIKEKTIYETRLKIRYKLRSIKAFFYI